MEHPVVTAIAFNRSEAKLTLIGAPQATDMMAVILSPIADANIDVDMILQNEGAEKNTYNVTFTVHRDDFQRAEKLLKAAAQSIQAQAVMGDNRIAKVSVIGVGMRSHVGVARRVFNTLAQEGIPVQLVTTSEIKISVVIDEKYLELAARSLHTAFNLDAVPHEEFDPVASKSAP